MAKIYVNGDVQEVQPEMVSVQVNEEFADADDWERIQLKEGDKVDFLYFMGGGSELRIKS